MASISAEHRNHPDQLPWRPAPPLVPEVALPAAVVRAMAGMLAQRHPATDAEALKLLRKAFPEFPLSARLAALAHMPR